MGLLQLRLYDLPKLYDVSNLYALGCLICLHRLGVVSPVQVLGDALLWSIATAAVDG